MNEEEQIKKARYKVTQLLSRREHSVLELIQKLSTTGIPMAIAEDVVSQFTDKHIQSDLRYAESVVNSGV
ncbi:regulatory protein RecX [Agaribacter flavus]|uniref:Regulatory protein RecX n=1 Tax=Agaribacter flavus TaxID=1902781 RepID=A0ABV7FRB1_9ALTE